MKHWTHVFGALLAASALATACGDDDDSGPSGTGATAGTAGSAGRAGTGGTGGSGGHDASAAGTGGTTDGGLDGAPEADAGGSGSEPLNAHGILTFRETAGSDAGDAGPNSRCLLATTDYFSKTVVNTIGLPGGALAGATNIADGDVIVQASAGRAFALARTLDRVIELGTNGQVVQSIALAEAGAEAGADGGSSDAANDGGDAADAHASLALSDKAYVPLYNTSRVAVLDLAAGKLAGSIDLSEFQDASDSDGRPDIDVPVYVPSLERAYFVASRLDINSIKREQGRTLCSPRKALLVAVDVETDQIVDLNGAADGRGIELSLTNPGSMVYDAAGNRLLIANAGCEEPADAADGGYVRKQNGIEAVSLASATASVVLPGASNLSFSQLELTSAADAVISAFDPDYMTHWYRWHIGDATLGAELSGVPDAPQPDNAGGLVGASLISGDAGSSVDVVRYTLTNGNTTTLSSLASEPDFYVASSALVR